MTNTPDKPRGETDLAVMLAGLEVAQRPGTFAYVHLPPGTRLAVAPAALVEEAEGTTVIVDIDAARREGWPVDFAAAWLTLSVHSALESVGLTAAVAGALARVGIPCNVLAGVHHDHLLVPVADAARSIETLQRLRSPRPDS